MERIFENPLWPEVRKYLFKERYTNQARVGSRERYRREVSKHIPSELLKKLSKIKIPCAKCGKPCNAVEVTERHSYLNVAHGHKTGMPCARSKAAALAAKELERHIENDFDADPNQQELQI